MSPYIESLYGRLLEYDLIYDQLYDMTLSELVDTLENRQKGLSYLIWKQSYLIGTAFGKHFPKKPEQANPELYFKKKSIPMPDFLLNDLVKR